MTGSRMRASILTGLLLAVLAVALQVVQGEEALDQEGPSETQCRPYIEKALKDLGTGSLEENSAEVAKGAEGDDDDDDDEESPPLNEQGEEPANDSKETDEGPGGEDRGEGDSNESKTESVEDGDHVSSNENDLETVEVTSVETAVDRSEEVPGDDSEGKKEEDSAEDGNNSGEEQDDEAAAGNTETVDDEESEEGSTEDKEDSVENDDGSGEKKEDESGEGNKEDDDSGEGEIDNDKSEEDKDESTEVEGVDAVDDGDSKGDDDGSGSKPDEDDSKEDGGSKTDENDSKEGEVDDGPSEEVIGTEDAAVEESGEDSKPGDGDDSKETKEDTDEADSKEEEAKSRDKRDVESAEETVSGDDKEDASGESEEEEDAEPTPEEDQLMQEIDVPENLRPREHINQLLKLDEENEEKENAIQKAADIVLKDLKRLYDSAIKPLETLYKYRDLSNRHFGDPEIFSKPLVLFMGPWSGGKSSIINYLLDNEYKSTSLRTGAEPSPAYFNILMHGEEEEVLDGTQLAADWTFSGLQKFGQGMLDRLRGLRLKNKLLEKVNIVEIPGILEIRKQVQRLFPFNDACQWFIDRADIIFLVYDPAKLDVGPETEAILDQLKGREYQTRIILNKADQVKPEELMRVQGALIWNISPLMSSAEPPIMYSTSLWSLPYEAGSPTRLLYAQERAFLRDLRSAIDKRVEHKIASARRFAVRVRNHAKMVDCYLTTYYNHKSFFGNKKETSDKIIENPQDYHIYEGLSTLTNISRYDLPDPDVYKDFFRLNQLYDFQQLSSTCTYFRGCPINRLDVAIAYDLPELVGKYRKAVDIAMHEGQAATPPS